MNPHAWALHARVFELAQARGLRDFRVDYTDEGAAVVIALVLAPANDARTAEKILPDRRGR
jgi:hypothetical protein